MGTRFCETGYANPMFEISNVRQTGTVKEFYSAFESLLHLVEMTDEYALGLFLSNLKPEISNEIQKFYPRDLSYAFNLAKRVESKLLNAAKKPYPTYKNQSFTSNIESSTLSKTNPKTTLPTTTTTLPHNIPSKEERDDRRRKGLCMWCAESFVRGHKCIRS